MLAITGLGDELDGAIADEETRPVKTLSSLAILHAAPSTPLLDVYVLPSSTSISDSDPTGNNIVPLLEYPSGREHLELCVEPKHDHLHLEHFRS